MRRVPEWPDRIDVRVLREGKDKKGGDSSRMGFPPRIILSVPSALFLFIQLEHPFHLGCSARRSLSTLGRS